MEIILANIDNVVSCDILASKHSSSVQPLTNKFYCHYYCSLNFKQAFRNLLFIQFVFRYFFIFLNYFNCVKLH